MQDSLAYRPPIDTTLHIVIADDFADWRTQTRKLLAPHGECEVIAEADSGPAAVAKCAEMQPDVVLLAIGMPGLNGIEAARLIRQQSPRTKIVFLTQNNDSDIRDMAFEAGGAAYVLKTNAASELRDAIAGALPKDSPAQAED